MGVLSTQTYVNNIITDYNTVDMILRLQQQVIQLLVQGGFVLKKWERNWPEVLATIPTEDRTTLISLKTIVKRENIRKNIRKNIKIKIALPKISHTEKKKSETTTVMRLCIII